MSNVLSSSWSLLLLAVLTFGAVTPVRAQSADLGVGKTGPATASAGSNVTYIVTMQNNGPDDAASAELDDAIPAGMTFVSEAQSSGPAFTCATPTVGSGGTVTCTIASFVSGASATFSITLNIPAATPPNTLFSNTASVTSATFDPNNENDSYIVGTLVPGPQADVFISKSGPATVTANTDVSYAITVGNNGPDTATNVSWSDNLPGGAPPSPMTFVSFAQNSGPAFNCGVPSASTTCSIGSLAAGASATFTFVGHVPIGTPSGTTYSNTATVTSDSDSNNENDSATSSAIVSSADIGVTKSGPASAVAGAAFDYVIVLSNGGPDAAMAVRFDDPLPSGATFVSLTQNSGPSASCVTPALGASGDVACSIGALLNGQSAQFTVTVTAAATLADGTVLSNTVTATTDSVDSNPNNNTSTVNTTVSAQADLAVTKSGPATIVSGSNISYTLALTNNGGASASAVSLSDTLPPGEAFVSLTQNSGPAFICTTGATISCSNASLASGASAAFTLVAAVDGTLANGTTLTNTATATSTTPDPVPVNNTSTVITLVGASADLVLVKTGPPSVVPGSNLTYAMTLTNNGPSSAAAVTLSDPLPAGETFVSFNQTAGPAFVCTTPAPGVNGTITCTNASMAAGAVAGFNLVVAIPNSVATGTALTNAATATSSTPDPNGPNNAASATTNVVLAAPVVPTPTLDARMLLLMIALLVTGAAWTGIGWRAG